MGKTRACVSEGSLNMLCANAGPSVHFLAFYVDKKDAAVMTASIFSH